MVKYQQLPIGYVYSAQMKLKNVENSRYKTALSCKIFPIFALSIVTYVYI